MAVIVVVIMILWLVYEWITRDVAIVWIGFRDINELLSCSPFLSLQLLLVPFECVTIKSSYMHS